MMPFKNGLFRLVILLLMALAQPVWAKVYVFSSHDGIAEKGWVSSDSPDSSADVGLFYGNWFGRQVCTAFFMKYNLSGIPKEERITSVGMILRAGGSSVNCYPSSFPYPIDVFLIPDNSWSAATLTWNTKPDLGIMLGEADYWHDFNKITVWDLSQSISVARLRGFLSLAMYKATQSGCDASLSTAYLTVTTSIAAAALDQTISVRVDTPVSIVLSADDVGGEQLTYTVVAPPGHGTLAGTPPNVTYTPVPGYTGPDNFTFKVNDGVVDSNVATVSLTVRPNNNPPVAMGKSVTTQQGTAVGVALVATDIDGDTLSYEVLGGPAHGKVARTGRLVTYTPEPNYSGPDLFAFMANDGKIDSNIAVITITVNPQITLAAALDINRTWTTGGATPWYGQAVVRHDWVDGARSGSLKHGQSNWLRTTVIGPKTITFWWKTSSEIGDTLKFYVDGTMKAYRSGITDWQQKSFQVGSGMHTTQWIFSRNTIGSAGLNAGFVDQVKITAPAP